MKLMHMNLQRRLAKCHMLHRYRVTVVCGGGRQADHQQKRGDDRRRPLEKGQITGHTGRNVVNVGG